MLTHWCIRGLHGITCSAGTFKAKCGEKSATGYALQCGGLPTYIYIYQHIVHTITYMHMCKMISHQLRHLKTGSQARKVFRNSRTLRKQHYSNAWHSHFRHQFCSWERLGLQGNSPNSQNNPHKKCITSLEFELHPTTPVTNRFFGSLDLKLWSFNMFQPLKISPIFAHHPHISPQPLKFQHVPRKKPLHNCHVRLDVRALRRESLSEPTPLESHEA